MAVKLNLTVWFDPSGLHLADVVEERRPPHRHTLRRLADDLLRVLPDVFVLSTALTKSDKRSDLGQESIQRSYLVEALKTVLGPIAHQDGLDLLPCSRRRQRLVVIVFRFD
jgi:hypothetical protein